MLLILKLEFNLAITQYLIYDVDGVLLYARLSNIEE